LFELREIFSRSRHPLPFSLFGKEDDVGFLGAFPGGINAGDLEVRSRFATICFLTKNQLCLIP